MNNENNLNLDLPSPPNLSLCAQKEMLGAAKPKTYPKESFVFKRKGTESEQIPLTKSESPVDFISQVHPISLEKGTALQILSLPGARCDAKIKSKKTKSESQQAEYSISAVNRLYGNFFIDSFQRLSLCLQWRRKLLILCALKHRKIVAVLLL